MLIQSIWFTVCIALSQLCLAQESTLIQYMTNTPGNGLDTIVSPEKVRILIVQSLGDGRPIDDSSMQEIKNLEALEGILLIGTEVSDKTAALLSKLPNLTKVAILGGRVSNEGVEQLARLRKLELLVVWNTAARQASLSRFENPKLTSEIIEGAKSGKFVDFSGCPTDKLSREFTLKK